MWKVNGRRTPSDGKSSLCLWQGELKRQKDKQRSTKHTPTCNLSIEKKNINVRAHPSGAHEFISDFCGVRVAQSLIFCVFFVEHCISFSLFSFWPLYCLSLFDWRPLWEYMLVILYRLFLYLIQWSRERERVLEAHRLTGSNRLYFVPVLSHDLDI